MRTGRTGKTAYTYFYDGSLLTHMTCGNKTLHFTYSPSGAPIAVTYDGATYYYVLSLQGDVMGLLDSSGQIVVAYVYDAWGRLLETSGDMQFSLGLDNPLRYRGYVYDRETGLYYLQSRYYSSKTGRFLNADGYVSTGQGFLGNNMFAYCNNNPANHYDPMGDDAIWLQDTNTLGGVGHTGLLLQDSSGKWWHFYWGNNRRGSSGKSGTGNILMPYEGSTSLSSINKFYKKHYGSEYEQIIYFKGNFASSVSYAKHVDKNHYNFIFNNCMQVCTDVLRKGKFSKSNYEYKAFLLRVRYTAVPNSVYTRMRRFDSVVKKWHSSKWYQKLYLLSPGEAVWVL